MSEETDRIINSLSKYGLEIDESRIYLILLENSDLSALEISRKLKIARTRVYRILDRLIEKRLVILKQMSGGFRFVADDPGKIEELIIQKEVEVQELKNGVTDLVDEMKNLVGLQKSNSKVLYYQGQRGLSQVNWNLLRATGGVLSYEVATADAYLPEIEAEKLRQGIVDHKILVRTITNKTRIEPYTKVEELVKNFWKIKSIDRSTLEISADVFIYNNVYCWCQYIGGEEVFCVEIYNQKMADMQRQLFESLWNQAKVMKIINEKGEARV
ncbi:winged helix-turn-helix transcriptional regulator [Candidatus Shapirobacteria bacterium]|nr:winged helix-turn-helix transcriptional regulator [Candidatus Shapirobacteria bacterium]